MAEEINFADALPVNTLLQTVVASDTFPMERDLQTIIATYIAFIGIGKYKEFKEIIKENGIALAEADPNEWDPWCMSSKDETELYPFLDTPERREELYEIRGDFLSTFDFTWGNVKGASFVKRAKKWLSSRGKTKKMGTEEAGDLGSLLSILMPKPQTYYFDVTDNFDWHKGDFGDHGSCFFHQYGQDQRSLFQENGNYLGLRFFHKIDSNPDMTNRLALTYASPYNTDKNIYLGYGRAWLLRANIDDNILPLFNSYGLQTQIAAKILATYLGGYAQDVTLRNVPVHLNPRPFIIYDGKTPLDKCANYSSALKSYTFPNEVFVHNNRFANLQVENPEDWIEGNNIRAARAVDAINQIAIN